MPLLLLLATLPLAFGSSQGAAVSEVDLRILALAQ